MKMSGKISTKLPFQIQCEDESTERCGVIPQPEEQELISSELLRIMEQIYLKEVPKFQSLMALYQIEKEKARKRGRLRGFPKAFTDWRPEASESDAETASILGGLQPTVLTYKEYFLETKQHSYSYIYISQEHPTKRASIVYHLDSDSIEARERLKNLKFGVIRCLYRHSFAQRVFIWAAISLFKDPQYDTKSGLWCSKDSIGQTVPVLLSSLSHPLTVATDKNFKWFLDVFV